MSCHNGAILWRRLDQPGHESARVTRADCMWLLAGTAVFAHQQQPCRLDYQVVCDPMWRTVRGNVSGWLGNTDVMVDIVVDSNRWWINGAEALQVAGCTDLDLNFSPSTNLLPIRRLDLAIGQSAAVRAAWLHFPDFVFKPLEQVYHRIDAAMYRYESAGGAFVADLVVNEAGFATTYPDLWEQVAAT